MEWRLPRWNTNIQGLWSFGLFQGHSATLLRIFRYAAIKFMAYDQVHDVRPQFLAFMFSPPGSPASLVSKQVALQHIPTCPQETNLRRFSAGAISGEMILRILSCGRSCVLIVFFKAPFLSFSPIPSNYSACAWHSIPYTVLHQANPCAHPACAQHVSSTPRACRGHP